MFPTRRLSWQPPPESRPWPFYAALGRAKAPRGWLCLAPPRPDNRHRRASSLHGRPIAGTHMWTPKGSDDVRVAPLTRLRRGHPRRMTASSGEGGLASKSIGKGILRVVSVACALYHHCHTPMV